jgi:hypothetical protein
MSLSDGCNKPVELAKPFADLDPTGAVLVHEIGRV